MKRPETPPNTRTKFLDTQDASELMKINKWDEFLKLTKEEYPYWEDLKYKVKNWDIRPERVWELIKYSRAYHRQYIRISHGKGFNFNFSVPVFLQKSLHKLDMDMGGILQGDIIPPEEKDRYLISSIMEEAIASSQLEGAVTTHKVAREILEKNKKPQTGSEQMIVNNYEVMRWILKNYDKQLTPESLLVIHSIITKDTLKNKSDEGNYRDNDDETVNEGITNEIFYIPPSYKNLQQLIADFCQFANNEDSNLFIHPVIKAIILHFLIGYIHPFVDGNGRTARAVFYWYLIQKGYWLVEYMSISRIILKAKSQYARAYLHTEYDENDLTYFIAYNIRTIEMALGDLKEYIRKKAAEKKKMISLLRDTNLNDRQIVLVKDIMLDKNQYFTVKQVESRFSVSNQTARNDLTSLVKRGILIEKNSGRKVQFFASDNFERILKLNS